MAYVLDKDEQKLIAEIEATYYMQPMLAEIHRFVKSDGNTKKSWQNAFDQIHKILMDANAEVQSILKQRLARGEIKDAKQATKAIAGAAFSNVIVYIFLQNKVHGTIKSGVFITSKKSKIKGFEKIATIHVSNETQKPDCDLVVFTKTAAGHLNKCMILSLKTSLRERAGQTYKWKLLLEIATSENSIKEKYDISYDYPNMPLIAFVTVNFYNEINSPQHRGMFKFFDKSFIAKEKGSKMVSPLSHLPNFVNKKL